MQVVDLLSMARIEAKEVLSSLRHALDQRADRQKDSCFVLRAADDDAGDFILKGLGGFVRLHEFTPLVLPVF